MLAGVEVVVAAILIIAVIIVANDIVAVVFAMLNCKINTEALIILEMWYKGGIKEYKTHGHQTSPQDNILAPALWGWE